MWVDSEIMTQKHREAGPSTTGTPGTSSLWWNSQGIFKFCPTASGSHSPNFTCEGIRLGGRTWSRNSNPHVSRRHTVYFFLALHHWSWDSDKPKPPDLWQSLLYSQHPRTCHEVAAMHGCTHGCAKWACLFMCVGTHTYAYVHVYHLLNEMVIHHFFHTMGGTFSFHVIFWKHKKFFDWQAKFSFAFCTKEKLTWFHLLGPWHHQWCKAVGELCLWPNLVHLLFCTAWKLRMFFLSS